MKHIFFIFLSIFSFAQTKAKVVGVKDGDTIVVLEEGSMSTILRLAEVDTPEKGQPFGNRAKQFTSDMVFGKEITYYITTTDRYGRAIAKVYYDNNKYLSREIIRNGFGWWYYRYSDDKTLGELQEEARKNKIGLWQDKEPIPPWKWRKSKL